MIEATCIDKIRDKNNVIYKYIIKTSNGTITEIEPNVLKNAIYNNEIKVTNLSLTKDNRLISRTETEMHKPLKKHKAVYIKSDDIQRIDCNKHLYFKVNTNLDNLISKVKMLDNGIRLYDLKDSLIAIENENTVTVVTDSDKIYVKMGAYLFKDTHFLSIDMTNLDTSMMYNASYMFGNTEAKEINLSSMDTSNIESMYGMFSKVKLAKLDLRNFDTHKVATMNTMFDATQIDELDISNFNMLRVTNMQNMFSCARIKNLKMGSFSAKSADNIIEMFHNCTINKVDLQRFDFATIRYADRAFYGANIKELNLGKVDISSLLSSDRMFFKVNTEKLELKELIVNSINQRTKIYNEFRKNINNLEIIKVVNQARIVQPRKN